MAKLFRVILAATAIVGLLFVNGIPNGMGQNTTTPLPSPTPTSTTPSANPTESTIATPTPSPSIPEFPTWIILLLTLSSSVSATILRKRAKRV